MGDDLEPISWASDAAGIFFGIASFISEHKIETLLEKIQDTLNTIVAQNANILATLKMIIAKFAAIMVVLAQLEINTQLNIVQRGLDDWNGSYVPQCPADYIYIAGHDDGSPCYNLLNSWKQPVTGLQDACDTIVDNFISAREGSFEQLNYLIAFYINASESNSQATSFAGTVGICVQQLNQLTSGYSLAAFTSAMVFNSTLYPDAVAISLKDAQDSIRQVAKFVREDLAGNVGLPTQLFSWSFVHEEPPTILMPPSYPVRPAYASFYNKTVMVFWYNGYMFTNRNIVGNNWERIGTPFTFAQPNSFTMVWSWAYNSSLLWIVAPNQIATYFFNTEINDWSVAPVYHGSFDSFSCVSPLESEMCFARDTSSGQLVMFDSVGNSFPVSSPGFAANPTLQLVGVNGVVYLVGLVGNNLQYWQVTYVEGFALQMLYSYAVSGWNPAMTKSVSVRAGIAGSNDWVLTAAVTVTGVTLVITNPAADYFWSHSYTLPDSGVVAVTGIDVIAIDSAAYVSVYYTVKEEIQFSPGYYVGKVATYTFYAYDLIDGTPNVPLVYPTPAPYYVVPPQFVTIFMFSLPLNYVPYQNPPTFYLQYNNMYLMAYYFGRPVDGNGGIPVLHCPNPTQSGPGQSQQTQFLGPMVMFGLPTEAYATTQSLHFNI